MSNFYDLETDLEIEDVDQEEDEFEEVSEFSNYSAEEIQSKWGDLDFEELVAELQRYLETSRKYLFFSKKKRVVNAEEVSNLLQYINEKYPDVVRAAKDTMNRKDEIIANANNESNRIVNSAQTFYSETIAKAKDNAESIISRANAEAEEMVSNHSITQAARVRAEEIKDQCKKEMDELVAETNERCEAHKREAREWAENVTNAVYKFAAESLRDYQDIAKSNMEQINNVFAQCKSKYEAQMQVLGSNTDVQPND